MKTIKTLFLAIVAMMSMPSMADDYQWLTIKFIDDTHVDVALSDFSTITFDKGLMKLWNSAAEISSYDTRLLHKMFFKEGETTINQITTDSNSSVQVLTTSGVVVGNSVDVIARQPQGIYIVRQGGKAKKIVKP